MNGRSSQTGQTRPGLRVAPVDMARDIARRKGWPIFEPLRVEPKTRSAQERAEEQWMVSDHDWMGKYLREYAEQGDLHGVRAMLRQGADIRAVDELGETAIDKARAQFHTPHIGFMGKLRMAKIIRELRKAEEYAINPDAREETVDAVVSEQFKKTCRNVMIFTVGVPLAVVSIGAMIAGGVCGITGLISYPFETVFGSLPKEVTKFMLKFPDVPQGITNILTATAVTLAVAVGLARFNNFLLREKEYRTLEEDIKTAAIDITKTAFIFTSLSGYIVGAVANIAYLSQTGQLSLAGGILLVVSSFAFRLSRFLMEKEKVDYVKLLELGSRDLAIAALLTIATGVGLAYYGGVAIWIWNYLAAVGVIANYALVRWLLRNKRKSDRLVMDLDLD